MDEQERAELSMFIVEHHGTLAPLFALCTGESDRMNVVRALQNMLADPNDPGLRQRWAGVLRTLGAI